MKGIQEVCKRCGVTQDVIVRYISFRWIIPGIAPEDGAEISLDDEDVARVRLILDLQNEFGVNDEAVPIILHLIDQLNSKTK